MRNRLFVFGSNGEGQLGIQAEEIVTTPKLALSWHTNAGIETIHGGDNHTLFLTKAAEAFGSGDNRKGQLGIADVKGSRIEQIEKLYSNISFCASTCESSAYITNICTDDESPYATLHIEGASHWGELGSGNIASTSKMNRVEAQQVLPRLAIDFAAGAWHYVVILSGGEVWSWGKSRLDQMGSILSTRQRVSRPTRIEEDIPFHPVRVVCGKEFTYLVSNPELGKHHLLGRDKFSLRSSMPASIKGWKTIGATWHAIFVLFSDGRLTAWGKDNMWRLVPPSLPLLDQLAVGSEHVLALTQEGKLISWGWGKHGNCGNLNRMAGRLKNDMVDGFWNEIDIPGRIKFIGAGFCTSFVLTDSVYEDEDEPILVRGQTLLSM